MVPRDKTFPSWCSANPSRDEIRSSRRPKSSWRVEENWIKTCDIWAGKNLNEMFMIVWNPLLHLNMTWYLLNRDWPWCKILAHSNTLRPQQGPAKVSKKPFKQLLNYHWSKELASKNAKSSSFVFSHKLSNFWNNIKYNSNLKAFCIFKRSADIRRQGS